MGKEQSSNTLKSTKLGIIWGAMHSLGLIITKIFRVLFIPKILPSVAEYGLFSSVNFFTRYIQLLDFGSKSYFTKKLPHFYFNKSKEETQAFINQIFSFTLVTFLGIVIYLILASYFYGGDNADFYKVALLILIPSTILLKYRDLLLAYSNSIQDYKTAINLRLINDFSSLIFAVIGVYFGGAIGGVIGILVNECLMFMATAFQIRLRFQFVWGRRLFKNIKEYFNLFLINLIELINVTIDQTFILLVFSATEFGLYAFALMVHWLMIAVSNIFKTSLVPKIMALGKINPKKIKEMLDTVIISFIACCMILIPFIQAGFEVMINLYLTKFLIGLPIYLLAPFSGVTRALNGLLKDFYIVEDKEKKYIKKVLYYTVIAALFYLLIYFFEMSLFEAIYIIMISDALMLFILLYGIKAMKTENVMLILFLCGAILLYSYLYQFVSFLGVDFFILNLMNIIIVSGTGCLLLYRNKNAIQSAIEA